MSDDFDNFTNCPACEALRISINNYLRIFLIKFLKKLAARRRVTLVLMFHIKYR